MNFDPISAALGAAVAAVLVGIAWGLSRKAPAPVVAAPPPPPKAEKPSGLPLRLLALLQAESRLVDFLMDNLGENNEVNNALIVQSVRVIQPQAQAVLKQYLTLESVVAVDEGETVIIPKGFDPSAIRVLGNVAGEPPYTGTVQHPGWRVKNLKLNPPPAGADEFVLQPAEVQMG